MLLSAATLTERGGLAAATPMPRTVGPKGRFRRRSAASRKTPPHGPPDRPQPSRRRAPARSRPRRVRLAVAARRAARPGGAGAAPRRVARPPAPGGHGPAAALQPDDAPRRAAPPLLPAADPAQERRAGRRGGDHRGASRLRPEPAGGGPADRRDDAGHARPLGLPNVGPGQHGPAAGGRPGGRGAHHRFGHRPAVHGRGHGQRVQGRGLARPLARRAGVGLPAERPGRRRLRRGTPRALPRRRGVGPRPAGGPDLRRRDGHRAWQAGPARSPLRAGALTHRRRPDRAVARRPPRGRAASCARRGRTRVGVDAARPPRGAGARDR